MTRFFQVETRAGEPFQFQGQTLTPFARSLTIQLPGRAGGLVWNRPASILARGADGQEQVIPVSDVTRLAQWTILGAGLAVVLLLSILFKK